MNNLKTIRNGQNPVEPPTWGFFCWGQIFWGQPNEFLICHTEVSLYWRVLGTNPSREDSSVIRASQRWVLYKAKKIICMPQQSFCCCCTVCVAPGITHKVFGRAKGRNVHFSGAAPVFTQQAGAQTAVKGPRLAPSLTWRVWPPGWGREDALGAPQRPHIPTGRNLLISYVPFNLFVPTGHPKSKLLWLWVMGLQDSVLLSSFVHIFYTCKITLRLKLPISVSGCSAFQGYFIPQCTYFFMFLYHMKCCPISMPLSLSFSFINLPQLASTSDLRAMNSYNF